MVGVGCRLQHQAKRLPSVLRARWAAPEKHYAENTGCQVQLTSDWHNATAQKLTSLIEARRPGSRNLPFIVKLKGQVITGL
jgi:hypothetical protein